MRHPGPCAPRISYPIQSPLCFLRYLLFKFSSLASVALQRAKVQCQRLSAWLAQTSRAKAGIHRTTTPKNQSPVPLSFVCYLLFKSDRKTKQNKHLQINSGRRIIPLAVFQDFRSPASSKNKKPRSNICEQGETEIYFSISSLPTRLSSSLDWVSVRSCRNNYTNRPIFLNGRLSLSR